MASAVVSSDLQFLVSEYGVYCELWPQFAVGGRERRRLGLEVELIGSHTPDVNHIDPACPMCSRLRSLLLAVAKRIMRQTTSDSRPIHCSIDSHTNSILCLPARGNRSFVWVSLSISWSDKAGLSLEADVLSDIKERLSRLGIRQR
jgi:hypothetical protein